MSARPTRRVLEAEGAAAGGLVSQSSAEAGSAAEVKAALTRIAFAARRPSKGRLRWLRFPADRELQAKIAGQVARRHAELGFGDLPAEGIADDLGGQFGDRRAGLFASEPPQDRRVITADASQSPGRGEV